MAINALSPKFMLAASADQMLISYLSHFFAILGYGTVSKIALPTP
jgi:hypothetical protein